MKSQWVLSTARWATTLALALLALTLLFPSGSQAQTSLYQQWPHPSNWIILSENGQIPGVTVFRWTPFLEGTTAGTTEDVWSGNQDTIAVPIIFLPTTAAVNLRISSSSAGDTQTLVIQGLNAAGDLITFNATLAGLTFVDTGQAILRLVNAKNTGATIFAGRIFLHIDTVDTGADGIPDAPTTELLGVIPIVPVSPNMLLHGAFTCPNDHTCYIVEMEIAAAHSAAAGTIMVRLLRKEGTGTLPFLVQNAWIVTTTGGASPTGSLFPGTKIPELHDIKIQTTSIGAGGNVVVNAVIFAFRN